MKVSSDSCWNSKGVTVMNGLTKFECTHYLLDQEGTLWFFYLSENQRIGYATNIQGDWSTHKYIDSQPIKGYSVTPVSYTHLDVYKRQGPLLFSYPVRPVGGQYTMISYILFYYSPSLVPPCISFLYILTRLVIKSCKKTCLAQTGIFISLCLL